MGFLKTFSRNLSTRLVSCAGGFERRVYREEDMNPCGIGNRQSGPCEKEKNVAMEPFSGCHSGGLSGHTTPHHTLSKPGDFGEVIFCMSMRQGIPTGAIGAASATPGRDRPPRAPSGRLTVRHLRPLLAQTTNTCVNDATAMVAPRLRNLDLKMVKRGLCSTITHLKK